MPAKVLVRFVKRHPLLLAVVVQGFSLRDKSLGLAVVAQRLEAELGKWPQMVSDLYALWLEEFVPLMRQLNAPGFSPTPQVLGGLRKKFGEAALRYGLLHAERDELHALADGPASGSTAAPPVATAISPARPTQVDKPRAPREATSSKYEEIAAERNALKAELLRTQQQLKERDDQLAAVKKQADDAENRLARELRRGKKAEEEFARLRNDLQKQKKAVSPPAEVVKPEPVIPGEIIDTLSEAIAMLQRGLASAKGSSAVPESVPEPVPVKRTAKTPPTPRINAAVTLTLPSRRGKQTYSVANILTGLCHNDEKLLEQVRDGIALLADQPLREHAAVAELTKAGIPGAILAGPLRPAVIDGSNAANLNPETTRARIDYLLQVRRSAWREGYFPVIIIVDASLRHQLDRSDMLMDMVERGEVIMAPAGTSADEMLIDETIYRHAVLITNDRMNEWPAARELEKRHIELISGTASIGAFHRAEGLWFY